MMDLIDAARRIVEESGTYTGGPIQYFEQAGRNTFVTALRNGLLPDHKLLDFGAGCLRLGYWFMRFLEPGNYYAMEPVKKMVDAGLNNLFDKSLLEYKKPTVRISDKCDMSAFGTDFDFVIARSILTHTTPGKLGKNILGVLDLRRTGSQVSRILLGRLWTQQVPSRRTGRR
jgi:hypothetical protein